jgi:hypothetical protein
MRETRKRRGIGIIAEALGDATSAMIAGAERTAEVEGKAHEGMAQTAVAPAHYTMTTDALRLLLLRDRHPGGSPKICTRIEGADDRMVLEVRVLGSWSRAFFLFLSFFFWKEI